MATGNRRRSWLLSICAFLVSVGFGASLAKVVDDGRVTVARQDLRDRAQLHVNRLQYALDRALLTLDVVAAIVRERKPADQLDLSDTTDLPIETGAVESIAFAPAGLVTQVVPMTASGRGTQSWNLFQEPLLRSAMDEPLAGRLARLAGPILLPSRRVGLVGYRAVWLAAAAPGRNDSPWGFVAITIPLQELLKAVEVDQIVARSHDYQLSIAGPHRGRPLAVARSRESLTNPVVAEASLAYGTLSLAIAPREGWRSSNQLLAEAILVSVSALLVAFATYRLVREPETLRQEIESRQRRLSQARQHLRAAIIDRQSAEKRSRHDTTHDALTGLLNRASFIGMVRSAIEFTRRTPDACVAVLFIDVDRMKQINDSLGPGHGDRLLVEIAARLQHCLSAEDVLARVGGDEFAILGAVHDATGATALADRLLREIRRPFTLDAVEIVVSASIGIVSSDPEHGEDLLGAAAAANHRAKLQGRGRWVLFEETMRARARHRVELEAELRLAVTRNEFVVHYEPVVSLVTGQLSGFEALVRWQHPVRGLVSPGEFIPIAEETGLIVPIDRWVLTEAARRTCLWHDRFDSGAALTISVNLSGAELTEPGLFEHVASTLTTSGLYAGTLKMELTESSVVEAAGAGAVVLRHLRELGVRLSLDDFGTGYSSFAYVQQFSFDTVKIDRSFVRTVHTDTKSREIVETITTLAHSLGMDVVAEGIDGPEQLATLREIGCDYAQGWYFAKPQDGDSATRFIESAPTW